MQTTCLKGAVDKLRKAFKQLWLRKPLLPVERSHVSTGAHTHRLNCYCSHLLFHRSFLSLYRHCSGVRGPRIDPLKPSQSHVTTDDQSVSQSWCRPLSGTHDQILVFLDVWGLCRRQAPCLTRGWVCHVSEVLVLVRVPRLFANLLIYNIHKTSASPGFAH
jgi:hypothetical protein